MNQTEIKFHRSKSILLIIPMLMVSSIILALSAATLHLTKVLLSHIINAKIYWTAVVFSYLVLSISGLLLFLVIASPVLFVFIKSIFKKPAFILNETGITNLTRLISWKFIPWKSIESLEGFRAGIRGARGYIAIDLQNQEEFISNQSFLVRVQLKLNLWWYGHAIVIGTLFLKGHFKPVVDKVKSAWKENK
jgi:hypothetical protein